MTHDRPRYRSTAGVVLLALVGYAAGAGCLAGCAGTQGGQTVANPLQQTVAAREAYTSALAGLNAAHRLGYLEADAKARIEPFRKSAADGLDRMEDAALAGDAGAPGGPFAAALAGFQRAMEELARYQLKAQQAQAAVERVRAAQQQPPPPAPAPAAAPKR